MAETAGAEKVRENRIRRAAARQGLAIHKSRARDPLALTYGRYWLQHGNTGRTLLGGENGTSLDKIEAHLRRER